MDEKQAPITQGYLDGYNDCLKQLSERLSKIAPRGETTVGELVQAINEIISFTYLQRNYLDEMARNFEEYMKSVPQLDSLCDEQHCKCDECEEDLLREMDKRAQGVEFTVIIGGKPDKEEH